MKGKIILDERLNMYTETIEEDRNNAFKSDAGGFSLLLGLLGLTVFSFSSFYRDGTGVFGYTAIIMSAFLVLMGVFLISDKERLEKIVSLKLAKTFNDCNYSFVDISGLILTVSDKRGVISNIDLEEYGFSVSFMLCLEEIIIDFNDCKVYKPYKHKE